MRRPGVFSRTMSLFLGAALATLCLGFQGAGVSEDGWVDPLNETQAQRDARMKWWREARFGMFIHWGVYAVPAGTYKGKQIPGIGEWIMLRARIPVAEYRAFAKRFNPVKYDPDRWVRLAKEAGMKYMVITSKHHDGFALFPSKASTWNVKDATPYGRDLLKPLEEACKRHGLRLGFYYSQAQDWNNPGGAKAGFKEGDGWDEAHKGDFDAYLRNVAYPQVKEILTGYDIGILWWDTPVWMNRARAEYLRALLRLKPGLITNNRLGGGFKGDTDTPEQHIPDTGIPGRDWETCMTMNHTWGYKSYDHDWKSVETLVRNLIDIVSKGGNYLLNVGPTALGEIPPASVERLKGIGRWMKVNGEAIYATQASPFRRPSWGRCTRKPLDGGKKTRLFLHVFHWPGDGRLPVPVKNPVLACRLLMDPSRTFETEGGGADGVVVRLTGEAPDPIASVVVLDVEGAPEVIVPSIHPAGDGTFLLPASEAEIHNPKGAAARYESGGVKNNIGFWTDPRAWVEWRCTAKEPGAYEVTLVTAAPVPGARFSVTLGEARLEVEVPRTGGYDTYQDVPAGRVTLGKEGIFTVSVRPVKEGWHPVNLRAVKLAPVR